MYGNPESGFPGKSDIIIAMNAGIISKHNYRLLAKNPESIAFRIFSFVPQGTASFAWHTQHHLSFSSTSLPPCAAQMNDVALRANDVLRNDVGFAK